MDDTGTILNIWQPRFSIYLQAVQPSYEHTSPNIAQTHVGQCTAWYHSLVRIPLYLPVQISLERRLNARIGNFPG